MNFSKLEVFTEVTQTDARFWPEVHMRLLQAVSFLLVFVVLWREANVNQSTQKKPSGQQTHPIYCDIPATQG